MFPHGGSVFLVCCILLGLDGHIVVRVIPTSMEARVGRFLHIQELIVYLTFQRLDIICYELVFRDRKSVV